MLAKLDDIVYHAASKPLIDLLQKWFHWNRFQLIATCLKSMLIFDRLLGILFALVSIIAVFVGIPVNEVMTPIVFAVLLITAVVCKAHMLKPLISDLSECAHAFENDGWPKPSTRMIVRKFRAQSVSEFDLAWSICTIAFCGFVWVADTTQGILISAFVLYYLTELFEDHLWRSSDVDPRDRRSVLEPKGEASSAS